MASAAGASSSIGPGESDVDVRTGTGSVSTVVASVVTHAVPGEWPCVIIDSGLHMMLAHVAVVALSSPSRSGSVAFSSGHVVCDRPPTAVTMATV